MCFGAAEDELGHIMFQQKYFAAEAQTPASLREILKKNTSTSNFALLLGLIFIFSLLRLFTKFFKY